MKYLYLKWLLKLMSVLTISGTTIFEFQWATSMYKNGWYAIPLAAFPPVAMSYFFIFVKIRDRAGGYSSSMERELRPDLLKFVILAVSGSLLFHWQRV